MKAITALSGRPPIRSLPPPNEIFTVAALVARNPNILTVNSVRHALRNRATNGLAGRNAVLQRSGKNGAIYIWEPAFIAWFLNLP